MKFEDVKGHKHLTDEIVTRDAYKVRSLIFPPDVVFDIGANIGIFTHFVHDRFPNATIVAVEPHPANFAALKEYAPKDRAILLNKGIGYGPLTRYPDIHSTDGNMISSGEGYHSNGFGYETPDFGEHPLEDASHIPSVLLDELYHAHVKPGQRLLIKIDCEGAENLIFAHEPSVKILQAADFVAIELHHYWLHQETRDRFGRNVENTDSLPGEHGSIEWKHGGFGTKTPAQNTTGDSCIASRAYEILLPTHRADSEPPMFYAWRRPDGEPIESRAQFGQLLKERRLLDAAAEIGVATGLYSRQILDWGVKSLLLVDPWRELPKPNGCGITDEAHEKNYQLCLESVGSDIARTTVQRMTSQEAAIVQPDNSLDFCYIDAQHKYHGISADLKLWWPKVRSGGILAGHDYLQPALGVNQAVKEFAEVHNLQIHLVIEHQMDASFWLEKP